MKPHLSVLLLSLLLVSPLLHIRGSSVRIATSQDLRIFDLARQLGKQLNVPVSLELFDNPEDIKTDTNYLAADLAALPTQEYSPGSDLCSKIAPYLQHFQLRWDGIAVTVTSDFFSPLEEGSFVGGSSANDQIFPYSSVIIGDSDEGGVLTG